MVNSRLLTPTLLVQPQHSGMQLSDSVLKNNLYLHVINYYDIKTVWDELLPMFSTVFRTTNGRYNAEDILNGITENKQQIWLARRMDESIQMCCITEIRDYPRTRTCFISDCVGKDHQDWMWVLKEIEEWAKELGCSMIELEGRLGWAKILKKYKKEKILFSYEIKTKNTD